MHLLKWSGGYRQNPSWVFKILLFVAVVIIYIHLQLPNILMGELLGLYFDDYRHQSGGSGYIHENGCFRPCLPHLAGRFVPAADCAWQEEMMNAAWTIHGYRKTQLKPVSDLFSALYMLLKNLAGMNGTLLYTEISSR